MQTTESIQAGERTQSVNVEAVKRLGLHTRGFFTIWDLAGDSRKKTRQSLMIEIEGRNVPVAKCGVSELCKRFYGMAGSALDGYTCENDREAKFREWATRIVA